VVCVSCSDGEVLVFGALRIKALNVLDEELDYLARAQLPLLYLRSHLFLPLSLKKSGK
jgi:hypothetical protein